MSRARRKILRKSSERFVKRYRGEPLWVRRRLGSLRGGRATPRVGPNGIAAAVSRSRCVAVVRGGSSGAGGLPRPWLADAGVRVAAFAGGDGSRTRRCCRWPVGREEAPWPPAPAWISRRRRGSPTGGSSRTTGPTSACPQARGPRRLGTSHGCSCERSAKEPPPVPTCVHAGRGPLRRTGRHLRFEPDGELAPGTARVHLSRDEGSRWIRLAGP